MPHQPCDNNDTDIFRLKGNVQHHSMPEYSILQAVERFNSRSKDKNERQYQLLQK